METRPSYLVVGVFVLVLSIAAAGFAVWLAKTDIDQGFDTYEVAFTGSVQGLQDGNAVQYRGVPVGRVRDIRIDPDDVELILATIEVAGGTPVKADTEASLALQGITGLANIELSGGSNDSPPLKETATTDPPRIRAAPSALEQVFESTPELLSRAVTLMERLSALVSEENVGSVSRILKDLESFTATLTRHEDDIDTMLSDGAGAAHELARLGEGLNDMVGELAALSASLTTQVDKVGATGTATLAELEAAARAYKNLAWRADQTLEGLKRPLDDFAESGLYDFSELVREMRQLVSTLSRITKEVERDPAGFLLNGSQRGFTPQ